MPRTNANDTYRPQYIPAFQTNSDGIMVNNSAATQMMVGLQQIILEQDKWQRRALESEHMKRRQGLVDRYNSCDGPDTIRTKKWVATLPTVASPQPVITGLYGRTGIQADRVRQEKSFAGSFLAKEKGYLGLIYRTVDDALLDLAGRKGSLTVAQRIFWSKKKKSDFVCKPLYEAVERLDELFREDNNPLRIKWREVKSGPNELEDNIYFVFPNTIGQHKEGFDTWLGSEDVTNP